MNAAQVFAISSIVFLTWINARGVALGKLIQNTFTSTKIISVVAIAIAGLIYGFTSGTFSLHMSALWTDAVTPVAVEYVGGNNGGNIADRGDENAMKSTG